MAVGLLAWSANVNTPKATDAAFAAEEAFITGTGEYLRVAREEPTLCAFPFRAAPGDGVTLDEPGSEPSRLPRLA